MERKKRVAAAWAACALWMAFIYAMSAAPGEISGEQSGLVVRLLCALLPKSLSENAQIMAQLETLVRKAAHMTEYAVLFCLYRRALRMSGVHRAGVLALALSVGYAATDEFHQAFVPERGPSVIDVMIDGCGAMIGWAACCAAAAAKARFTRSYRQKSGQGGE